MELSTSWTAARPPSGLVGTTVVGVLYWPSAIETRAFSYMKNDGRIILSKKILSDSDYLLIFI